MSQVPRRLQSAWSGLIDWWGIGSSTRSPTKPSYLPFSTLPYKQVYITPMLEYVHRPEKRVVVAFLIVISAALSAHILSSNVRYLCLEPSMYPLESYDLHESVEVPILRQPNSNSHKYRISTNFNGLDTWQLTNEQTIIPGFKNATEGRKWMLWFGWLVRDRI